MKRPMGSYRRLLQYVWRYFFPYGLLLAFSMLVLSTTSGTIPFLVRDFVTKLQSGNAAALHPLLGAIFGVFLARAAGNFGADYLSSYLSQRVGLDLRNDLYARLHALPISFFNRAPTGVIQSRVINDINVVVRGATTNGLFSIFKDGSALAALGAAAFYIDWRMALIGFIVFPAAVAPVVQFSKKMRRMTKSAQKQLGGLQMLLHETLQGNRVVKAFGMEDYEQRRFNTELRRYLKINMRVERLRALTGPLIEVMAAFAIVAVLWYGAGLVVAGSRTTGAFGAFMATMLLIYQPFKRLGGTNNSIQQGLAAAERVFEVMDEPTDVPDAPDAIELPAGSHCIEFEKVSFRYGKQWVLRAIDLRIGQGEVVALVGMSGGGKSTLADLIPRFYDVQQGAIMIDGVDIRRYRLKSLRAEIGLVTQQTFLFNDTVRANIAYGSIDKSEDEIVAAAKLANAHDFIVHLPQGYETEVGELGVALSGGERQRIAIARALLKDAPILILDEATSALDSQAERLVQEALEHLMVNRTTLVVAHRLSTIRRASRIVVLSHGRIVEVGTHEELFALGREYRKLYDLQFVAPPQLAGNGSPAE